MRDTIILTASTQTIATYALDYFHLLTFPTMTLTIMLSALMLLRALTKKEHHDATTMPTAYYSHPYNERHGGICCGETSTHAEYPLLKP